MKLNGNEQFTLGDENSEISVFEFWNWTYSDVFCVYTAKNREQSILNLDLWDFYVLPTCVLNQQRPNQKSISFDSLLKLHPTKAGFLTLGYVIETIEL